MDAAPDVLDLGAGTGKLTGGLVALGHRVTAVEPDPAMLAQLRALLPGVTAPAGGAEEIPLPDASVDAVVVGQAFHWFDQERALPEIARVLRPGGVLGALWNLDDDRVEWVAELGRLMREDGRAYVQWSPADGIAAHPSFDAVRTARFAHRQRSDVDSLLATMATHSGMLVLDAPDRHVVPRPRIPPVPPRDGEARLRPPPPHPRPTHDAPVALGDRVREGAAGRGGFTGGRWR